VEKGRERRNSHKWFGDIRARNEIQEVTARALGRKFLRLDQFLKPNSAKAEEKESNPKLFQ
jgi:hypothetical protein